MILTYDGYLNYLLDWCTFRADSFKYYFPLKGGWEAWVQADFAAFILSKDNTIEILREQPIYKNGQQRVDLLFNDGDNPPPVAQMLAIEIKCQSFDNRNAFTAGMGQDVQKMAQGNISNYYQGIQTAAMGFCFEQTAVTWMTTNNFTAVFNNGEIFCGIRKLYP